MKVKRLTTSVTIHRRFFDQLRGFSGSSRPSQPTISSLSSGYLGATEEGDSRVAAGDDISDRMVEPSKSLEFMVEFASNARGVVVTIGGWPTCPQCQSCNNLIHKVTSPDGDGCKDMEA